MKMAYPVFTVGGLTLTVLLMRPLGADEDLTPGPAVQGSQGLPTHVSDQLIVKFHDGVREETAPLVIREAGGAFAQRSAFARRYLVTLDAGFGVEHALRRFRAVPEVEYAEPNGIAYGHGSGVARFTPNDRYFPDQWHMRLIDADRVWAIQRGDPSVAIAVVDSGIAYEDYGAFKKAPDFGGTVFLPGWHAFAGTNHANDDHGHGTHVSSTIAEATNNGIGCAGLAHGSALMPVKVLNDKNFAPYFVIAEGVDYATHYTTGGERPVKVINLSLGGSTVDTTLRTAIEGAVAAGITVVVSVGNDEAGKIQFPASLENVIAVGAVDGRKIKTPYSNWGPELDIVAPGGDSRRDDTGPEGRPDGYPDGVLQQTFSRTTAVREGRYDAFGYYYWTGTSMAAPHVSALAALLYRQGIRDPKSIRAAIESTAEDLGAPGRDDFYGKGLIRPVQALTGLGLAR